MPSIVPPNTPAQVSIESLTALFDNVRSEHQIDVMQSHLLACTCGASLPITYGDDGQPLYNPAIRHHHEKQAEAVIGLRLEQTRETFALGAAWAMGDDEESPAALKARAEEAEFHVEQLRDARDRAEVLAERLANDAALVRLAQAEALRTAARVFVDEMADAWGRDSPWLTTGTRVAEVVGAVLREMASDLEGECAHEWLDRPESDTRECLICGTEVSG